MIGRLPWARSCRCAPLRRHGGRAPAAWGRISTTQPRAHGGNLDNKELVAGTTLYLPVWTEGAQFSAGDGHGVQGDGEVCVTAIETALEGVFDFNCGAISACASGGRDAHGAHHDGRQRRPRRPAKDALRDMITLIRRHTDLDAAEAYIAAAWPPTSGSPSWSTSRRAATWSCRRRPSATQIAPTPARTEIKRRLLTSALGLARVGGRRARPAKVKTSWGAALR